MKIGDLVYDDDYGMNGIIVEEDGDHLDFVVLYEDGDLGDANEGELELI